MAVILAHVPQGEEAYWFAEGAMPPLREKGIYGPAPEAAREPVLV